MSGDSVHVSLTVLRQLSAFVGFLDQFHGFELLECQSSDMSVTFSGVGWSESSVGGTSVDGGHSSGTHGTLDVQLSGDSSGSDIPNGMLKMKRWWSRSGQVRIL